jgi:phosphatidylserine/phosphatidylglycerophosphate/cardiolipin synthase-like enzyme
MGLQVLFVKFARPEQKSKSFYSIALRFFLASAMFFSISYWTYSVLYPPLPTSKTPLLFYSNQTGDDLKRVLQLAIKQAKKSLFLQIYGCTDPHLIKQIQKAPQKGLQVDLFYDESGSGPLHKKIPQAIPIACAGLMHKKILILDDQNVFIGTANLTPTSLTMHDNIIIGMQHKELAHFIKYSPEPSFSFALEGQQAQIWHLPDFQNACLNNILSTINSAQSSIHLALFTFTHPKIVQALIQAKHKGVDVQVALDCYTSHGASKKTAKILQEAGISLYISKGGKLLHHKWCVIDDSILFLGSANWTKSAFSKNEDCLLRLNSLTQKQTDYFNRIWKDIQKNSKKSCVL